MQTNRKVISTITAVFLMALGMTVGINSSHGQVIINIPINNASFEAQVLPNGGTNSYTNNSVTGWTIDGTTPYSAGVQHWTTSNFTTTNPLPSPADGNNSLYVGKLATVYQDVGLLMANTTYTLTLAVGNRLESGSQGGGIFQLINGTTDLDTVLATSVVSTPVPGSFNAQAISFTTGANVAGDLVIALKHTVSVGGNSNVEFDNLILTAEIPEPSTWALLLGGLIVMGFTLRWRCIRTC